MKSTKNGCSRLYIAMRVGRLWEVPASDLTSKSEDWLWYLGELVAYGTVMAYYCSCEVVAQLYNWKKLDS